MKQYCTCKDKYSSGYISLAPVVKYYVHGECLRPSYLTWQAFALNCEECGRYFSTPVTPDYPLCRYCCEANNEKSSLTWRQAATKFVEYWETLLGTSLLPVGKASGIVMLSS